MIAPDRPDLLIARSSFYDPPKGESEQNLGLMRRIEAPFPENEKRIRRLMRQMGLMPIYQKPNTSRPAKGHNTDPYPLRGEPNQVWCPDTTYLPMRRGFLYLVAIMGWHTRKVLSWRISNTLEADFRPSRQICFANRLPGNGARR